MLLPTGGKDTNKSKGQSHGGLLDVARKMTSLLLPAALGTMRFIAAACMCMVLCLQAHGFYLPGVAPQDYKKVRLCHSGHGLLALSWSCHGP
jgi:hypothetical protein